MKTPTSVHQNHPGSEVMLLLPWVIWAIIFLLKCVVVGSLIKVCLFP